MGTTVNTGSYAAPMPRAHRSTLSIGTSPIRTRLIRMSPICVGSLCLTLAMACHKGSATPAAPGQAEVPRERAATSAAAQPESSGEAALPWQPHTFSPRPGSVPDERLSALVEACGVGDSALHQVAELAAEEHARTGHPMELERVSFELRRAGAPYVMPRMWAAEATFEAMELMASSVRAWARAQTPLGTRRCGVGVSTAHAGAGVAGAGAAGNAEDATLRFNVVAVDVLADLGPLPTEVDVGTRLDVHAALSGAPTAASVIVLPPTGAPFTIASELDQGRLSARFAPSAAGNWLVQIMATHVGGPRPVATAWVSVGSAPPQSHDSSPVPGEAAFDPDLAPSDALFSLLNAARQEHGLAPLARNPTLDRVARAHSRAMRAKGHVSHDTGDGDPARRVEAAGLRPQATGENVALAATVTRLHRVLWASPSHRENMLLRRWDDAGVAVLENEDGALLATEIFIDR